MTFCLGMAVDEGLVGIADTLVTSGRECITARKLTIFHPPGGAMFLMTSGLRSLRDKALTYFEEALAEREEPFSRLFHCVNLFANQIRRVAEEDRKALDSSGLQFNIHALIGGQMANDPTPKLYLVYPEGNWVDTGRGTPYQIIGSTGYGKPVLDRALKVNDSMRHAFKVGCLSFDSTRISAADVDFPIDVALYEANSFKIIEHRFEKDDLAELSHWWQDRIRMAVQSIPEKWADRVFAKLDEPDPVTTVQEDRA
ncbi:MAG: peptidase [Acidobacteria bacterium]|nr:peptidase [Acidobacteriota bacterium]